MIEIATTFDEVRESIKFGRLQLKALKSYEHMGKLRLQLLRVPSQPIGRRAPRAGPGEVIDSQLLWHPLPAEQLVECKAGLGEATELAAFDVDCAWSTHESEVVTEELSFDAKKLVDSCLIVRITVTQAQPPRGENKVKLLGLVFY